jgi:hypothetical protein
MGRKAGGKNFGNFTSEEATTKKEKVKRNYIEVSKYEKEAITTIFTGIKKDFIGVQDLIDASGLSYDTCVRLIREIKAVSDVFGISGYIHRTDYFIYLTRKFYYSGGNDDVESTTNRSHCNYVNRDNGLACGTHDGFND